MSHVDEALIHDFVDDELTGEERSHVATHLAECVMCRQTASSAMVLRDEARRAFVTVGNADAPDQWPAIAARIRNGASRTTHRGAFVTPWRAAAAVILLALSSGAVWALLRRPAEVALVPAPATNVALVTLDAPPAIAINDAYAPVFSELEKILSDERDRLQPETLATVEANIAILNKAIAEIQGALAADPANRGGLRGLDGLYQAKLGVLRRAVALSPEV